MIVSVLVRYFKTYSKINYIPLTSNHNFCALVGNNGIGKSSVLEALDCFFKEKKWNLNVATRKGGKNLVPFVIPIFLIEKDDISAENTKLAEILSTHTKDLKKEEVNSSFRSSFDVFIDHRKNLARYHDLDRYYLLPLGIDDKNNIVLSMFNTPKLAFLYDSVKYNDKPKDSLDDEDIKSFNSLLTEVKSLYHYIYIPKDINPEDFVKLETTEIQELMGESLVKIVSEIFPVNDLRKLNSSLNDFLDQVSEELEEYAFRTSERRQTNIKKSDINNLIIKAFFETRKLFKKEGDDQWLQMKYLSSGEKQKAIIEVANNLITKHRSNSKNIILGIDEPESSLHISACYAHFRTLYEMTGKIKQLVFSSHWYGFIPVVEAGSVTAITKKDGSHRFDNLDIANYREEIKQKKSTSKGVLPFDVRLKSLNDFIQTLITSILDGQEYKWIICEGSSEKIYFDHYFKFQPKLENIRIVPVGGAGEVKRIYENFIVAIKEFRSEIKGKVVFIIDTDDNLVEFETKDFPNVLAKRLVNIPSEKSESLVKISGNPKAPATDIESVLEGELFHKALLEFKLAYPDLLGFVDNELDTKLKSYNSFFAFDFRSSDKEKLQNFFKLENMKYRFAVTYVRLAKRRKSNNLKWVSEVLKFLN